MIVRLLALLLVVMSVLGVADRVNAEGDTLARIAARGTLIAAAVPDQRPLAARDNDGRLVGFDISVAEEVARRLGVGIAFVTPGWDTILGGDWNDRWDISVSSITPTDARAASLAFPAIYRFDPAVTVVRRDDDRFAVPSDTSGTAIGVKAETTFHQYLSHTLILPGVDDLRFQIDNPTIRLFPDKADAMRALTSGSLDAVVTSLATAQAAIADGVDARILPGFLFFEPVAVAVQPGDEQFARKIEEIILAMSADGSLGALSMKWFGIDLSQEVLP